MKCTYGLCIWNLDLGHPPLTEWSSTPSFQKWSPTILSFVTHHLQGGHPQSLGESPPFPRIITQLVLFLEMIHSQCCYLSKALLNACLNRPIFRIVNFIFSQIRTFRCKSSPFPDQFLQKCPDPD